MPAVDLSDFSHFTVAALELLRSLETQQVFKQSKELRSSLLRHLSTAQHPPFDTMLSGHFSVFLFFVNQENGAGFSPAVVGDCWRRKCFHFSS